MSHEPDDDLDAPTLRDAGGRIAARFEVLTVPMTRDHALDDGVDPDAITVLEPMRTEDERPSDHYFGPYRLVRALGFGGMAEVTLAVQEGEEGFERYVCLKRLRTDLVGDTTAEAMLIDEARLVARVSHPSIVQVYDLGRVEGRVYAALEHVDGMDLFSVLQQLDRHRERMPIDAALLVGMELAEALAVVHELTDERGAPLGVVHRDVSPSNVMVSPEGSLKLLDFGIAKHAARLVQTAGGAPKGKLSYMAPEQLRGEAIDARTDLFALGVVLHELLTGEPFHASDHVARMVRGVDVADVRARRPEVPSAVAELVRWMLALDMRQRPPSGWAVQAAIADLLGHEVPAARRRLGALITSLRQRS